MSEVTAPNINHLIQHWKKNTAMTSKALEQMGYSPQLLNRYKRSGWIRSLGKGAYALNEQVVQWTGGLYALQTQLKQPIHPGGLTALEWSGQAHYVTMGKRSLYLYGESQKNLPLWFIQLTESLDIEIIKAGSILYDPFLLTSREIGDFSVEYSMPELAFLEMLDQVPQKITFPEACQISENLAWLRSEQMQYLLEKNSSVKISRMVLYLGERYHHDWFAKLKLEKIDLGKGKRVIHPGGVFNKKYGITVPPLEKDETYV